MNQERRFVGKGAQLLIPAEYLRRLDGDLMAALLLSQISYWDDWSRNNGRDGWFYKSYDDWEKELFVGHNAISRAKTKLQNLGLIEVKLKKDPSGAPKNHWRINDYGFNTWADSFSEIPTCTNQESPLAPIGKVDLHESCNTSITEITNKDYMQDGNKPIGIDSKDNSVKAQAIKVLEDYIYSTLATSLRHSQKRPARKSAEAIATAMMLYYAPDGGDWYRGKGNKRVSISSWKRCCATFVNNAIAQNKIEFEETFIPLEQRARKVQ